MIIPQTEIGDPIVIALCGALGTAIGVVGRGILAYLATVRADARELTEKVLVLAKESVSAITTGTGQIHEAREEINELRGAMERHGIQLNSRAGK